MSLLSNTTQEIIYTSTGLQPSIIIDPNLNAALMIDCDPTCQYNIWGQLGASVTASKSIKSPFTGPYQDNLGLNIYAFAIEIITFGGGNNLTLKYRIQNI